jgi:hypothetical protein
MEWGEWGCLENCDVYTGKKDRAEWSASGMAGRGDWRSIVSILVLLVALLGGGCGEDIAIVEDEEAQAIFDGTSDEPLTFFTFEDGTLQGWQATGLWHVSSVRAHTDTYAVRYADAGSGNFDTGVQNFGALTLTDVTLSETPSLSFYYFLDNECSVGTTCTYDKLTVELSTDGGAGWTVLDDLPHASTVFEARSVDLSAHAGATVQLRFNFDTIDSAANTYEGAYVDSVDLL